MASIQDSIFKEYDIRAIADRDLTDDVAEAIGRAAGTYFMRKGERDVVLCRDARLSSPRIARAVANALVKTGCNVVDIGMNPTPLCYFGARHLGFTASVMVTASHNPAEYNGMKINSDGTSIFGEEIQKIRVMAQTGDVDLGEGSYRTYDGVEDAYVDWVREHIQLERKMHIAVDTGNGSAGPVSRRLFAALGCEAEILFEEPDGHFPNHHPDPTIPKNLEALRKVVLEKGYDFGVGFDGDGDRIGVVDDKGQMIWGDMLQIVFWREIMKKHPNSAVIVEVKCSRALYEEAEKLGGKPFFYKTGHSLIKAKMREEGLLFAGEMSGHMFFADEYFGFDDALYAAARLLRTLSRTNRRLSEMFDGVPKYCATPEIRIPCDEGEQDALIARARAHYEALGFPMITIDGLRVNFEGGWGLLRKSNTQPIIVMRAEASDPKTLAAIEADLHAALASVQEQ